MRAVLLGFCWFAFAAEAFAHRLDEYLQATRIAVTTNRVDLICDLTPGVAVAAQVLELIDQDRNGQVSDDEGQIYARRYLKDLSVTLDGNVVAPSVTTVSLPAVQEIRIGVGVIRVRATASIGPLAWGSHSLHLTNGHLPAISVYLVNALRPKDAAVEIGKQTRDEHQKDYRLEFRVKPAGP
jgi:hypothetical protein